MSKEWSRPTRYFIAALIFFLGIIFLYQARALISPLAIAALLAYVLNPLVTFVNKQARLSRTWVVALVYLISLAALAFAFFVLIEFLSEETDQLVNDLQQIAEQFQSEYLGVSFTILNTNIRVSSLIPTSTSFLTDIVQPDLMVGFLQSTTTNIGWIVVVFVTAYYLLNDWDRLRDWLFKWSPPDYGDDTQRLYTEVRLVWNRYLRGQLRLSFIVGLITGIGAGLIGLPGAIIFGLLAAVFDVLLTVGPGIVMVTAAIVALLAGSTVLPVSNEVFALVVLAVFGGIQGIENVWLRPRIMSSSLNIHPAIIFISIVASLALAGILAALIIVPVLGSVGVISRYIYCKLFKLDPWQNFPRPVTQIRKDPSDKITAPEVNGHSSSDTKATPEFESTAEVKESSESLPHSSSPQ